MRLPSPGATRHAWWTAIAVSLLLQSRRNCLVPHPNTDAHTPVARSLATCDPGQHRKGEAGSLRSSRGCRPPYLHRGTCWKRQTWPRRRRTFEAVQKTRRSWIERRRRSETRGWSEVEKRVEVGGWNVEVFPTSTESWKGKLPTLQEPRGNVAVEVRRRAQT